MTSTLAWRSRANAALEGAPRWLSGVLAGVQGAMLSVLVVVMPALAAYVATSADPSNAEIGWTRSVAVGGGLWLLGHGGSLLVDGVLVTLTPLGITTLALFTCYASARRSAFPGVAAWLAGIGGYLVMVLMVLLLAGSAGPLGAGGFAVLRTLVGASVVAALGLGAGTVRVRRVRETTRPLWSRVHPLVRTGTVAGLMVVCLLVGTAAAVTILWVLSGRAPTGDVIAGLGVDTFGGLLLAVAQLALLPNLVLWVVAWLAGPGFVVGTGSLFSPAEVVVGPLPALPLLAALPGEGSAGGAWVWVPLVLVVAGAVVGLWLHRRVRATRWWEPVVVSACTAGAAGLMTALAMLLADGAVGPGRMTQVGAPVLEVALTVAVGSGLGAMLVCTPADRELRAAVGRAVTRTAARLRTGASGVGPRASGEQTDPPVASGEQDVAPAASGGQDVAPGADQPVGR
ncbi:DUF6350 family protein [Actinotalea sp. K2]|uniref:cell division protein PerM n=1 Tax=Actinotalea sp. K2 TaxID=2939438 RepID=UPI002016E099|nr:DUF6350 family protein [Actinotalea sp. K2]MCL3859908.1 DUF6350 family protein [Actinotalea sp. K2]